MSTNSCEQINMGHLFRVVVGDWESGGQGAWRFNVDQTKVKHDIIVKENETYHSLVGMVHAKYNLDQLLLPSEPVILTYSFQDWSNDPGAYTSLQWKSR